MHHRPVRTSAIGFNVKGSGRSAFLLNRGKWSPEGCAINCRYMAHVSWWAVLTGPFLRLGEFCLTLVRFGCSRWSRSGLKLSSL